MQRFVAIVALLLQTGFALLGSGGLHALPGHHCRHVHGPAESRSAVPTACGHTHSHAGHTHTGSDGCGHHHHGPAGPTDEPRPFESGDDDCAICRLFVLGATVVLPATLVGSQALALEAVSLESPMVVDAGPRGPITTRGPPRA